jgi:predicted nucleic acid-binding protein
MKHEPIIPPATCCSSAADGRANEMVRALIANELDVIREILEDVGIELCTNPVIVQEYTEILQKVDELAQRNENLAKLLRATAMEPAIDTITLDSLKNRLLDAVTGYLADNQHEPGAEEQLNWKEF